MHVQKSLIKSQQSATFLSSHVLMNLRRQGSQHALILDTVRAHGKGTNSVTHSKVAALNSLQHLDKKSISGKDDSRRSAPAGAGGEEEREELKPERLRLSRPSSLRPGSSSGQRNPRVRATRGTSTENAPTEARRGSGESTPPGPDSGEGASTRRVGAASPGCSSLPEPCSNSPSAPASEFRAG